MCKTVLLGLGCLFFALGFAGCDSPRYVWPSARKMPCQDFSFGSDGEELDVTLQSIVAGTLTKPTVYCFVLARPLKKDGKEVLPSGALLATRRDRVNYRLFQVYLVQLPKKDFWTPAQGEVLLPETGGLKGKASISAVSTPRK
ncbi:MAG: hypothetical protein PHV34_07405 [Verrucomicrobiae bacterium]|nr:hypothetical protein [Verrucomicrobiae bacterium]